MKALLLPPAKVHCTLNLNSPRRLCWCVITNKVYKYKVVSTRFNDDIYSIEIIYLEERLHALVNILAMGSLV
jgi:hypothetical protein